MDPVVPSKCQSIRHAKEPKGQVVKAIERRLWGTHGRPKTGYCDEPGPRELQLWLALSSRTSCMPSWFQPGEDWFNWTSGDATSSHGPMGHKTDKNGWMTLYRKTTLPETNSSPLKMDGWNTILSYWVSAYFQGRLLLNFGRVSFWSFKGQVLPLNLSSFERRWWGIRAEVTWESMRQELERPQHIHHWTQFSITLPPQNQKKHGNLTLTLP